MTKRKMPKLNKNADFWCPNYRVTRVRRPPATPNDEKANQVWSFASLKVSGAAPQALGAPPIVLVRRLLVGVPTANTRRPARPVALFQPVDTPHWPGPRNPIGRLCGLDLVAPSWSAPSATYLVVLSRRPGLPKKCPQSEGRHSTSGHRSHATLAHARAGRSRITSTQSDRRDSSGATRGRPIRTGASLPARSRAQLCGRPGAIWPVQLSAG